MLPFLPPDVGPVTQQRAIVPAITLVEAQKRRKEIRDGRLYPSEISKRAARLELIRELIPLVEAEPFDPPVVKDENLVVRALQGDFGLGVSNALEDAVDTLVWHVERAREAQKHAGASPLPLHDQVRGLKEEPELVAEVLKKAKHRVGVFAVYYGGELLIWLDANITFRGATLLDGSILRFRAPRSMAEVPKELKLWPKWNSTFTPPRAADKNPWTALPPSAFESIDDGGKLTPAALVARFSELGYNRYGLNGVAHAPAPPLPEFFRPPWPVGAPQWASELVATNGNLLHAWRLDAPPPPRDDLGHYFWGSAQVMLSPDALSQRTQAVDRYSIAPPGEFPAYEHVLPSGAGPRDLTLLAVTPKSKRGRHAPEPERGDIRACLARLRASKAPLVAWQGGLGDDPWVLWDDRAGEALPTGPQAGAGGGPARSFVARPSLAKALEAFGVLPYPVVWTPGTNMLDPWIAVQADERGVVRQWHALMPQRLD